MIQVKFLHGNASSLAVQFYLSGAVVTFGSLSVWYTVLRTVAIIPLSPLRPGQRVDRRHPLHSAPLPLQRRLIATVKGGRETRTGKRPGPQTVAPSIP